MNCKETVVLCHNFAELCYLICRGIGIGSILKTCTHSNYAHLHLVVQKLAHLIQLLFGWRNIIVTHHCTSKHSKSNVREEVYTNLILSQSIQVSVRILPIRVAVAKLIFVLRIFLV